MRKHKRAILWTLFALYCAMMIYLLFLQRIGRESYLPYAEQLWTSLNLVPFRTISRYLAVINTGQAKYTGFLIRAAVMNTVGNIVLFIPLGVFLPCLWRRLRSFIWFLLCVTAAVAAVEVVQLFTLLGSCDIDDLLLNLLGASAGFWLYRLFSLLRSKNRTSPPRGKMG